MKTKTRYPIDLNKFFPILAVAGGIGWAVVHFHPFPPPIIVGGGEILLLLFGFSLITSFVPDKKWVYAPVGAACMWIASAITGHPHGILFLLLMIASAFGGCALSEFWKPKE
ncbi:hypothetical protein [Candidatus Methylacidithermus pantelleriae]|uniref:hypothetical protein n=1 Tax=Candidatus Methylacidithermus pantelleriae TaxID=2744239 RepID=UPI00157DA37C|nr:hypothetical protein [Candidatus Methylacidithermus pantelleriae]